jgi:hypothetical protein
MVWGDRQCCQGCRARNTFEKDPGLIGMLLDFWYRMGKFPESDSWLEGVPHAQLNLRGKEIRAGLNSDPMEERDNSDQNPWSHYPPSQKPDLSFSDGQKP